MPQPSSSRRPRLSGRLRTSLALAAVAATLMAGPVDPASGAPTSPTSGPPPTAMPAPNPEFPRRCGLDLAVVLDLSGSIDAGEFALMKAAAAGFVEAIAATPSAVALVTFASDSPASGAQNGPFPLTPLPGGGAAAVTARIAGLSQPSDEDLFTNWHAAFEAVGASADDYDGVVFLSDGNANRPLDQPLPAAITSANALKARGIRIVAVAIGDDLDVGNLASVSGPAEGHDWYRSGFDTLAATLRTLAARLCRAEVPAPAPTGPTPTGPTPTGRTPASPTPAAPDQPPTPTFTG